MASVAHALRISSRFEPQSLAAKYQETGGVVMGVGLATSAEISFRNGRVEQDNFDGYELTRIDGSPTEIRTHLVNTAAFDKQGTLWFTGQNGVYGRLSPATGAMASPSAASANKMTLNDVVPLKVCDDPQR